MIGKKWHPAFPSVLRSLDDPREEGVSKYELAVIHICSALSTRDNLPDWEYKNNKQVITGTLPNTPKNCADLAKEIAHQICDPNSPFTD